MVGHQVRGPISRQSGEPMVSYVSRRRRWWKQLGDLDASMDLSQSIRRDLVLEASNLEPLMVLTSTPNSRKF